MVRPARPQFLIASFHTEEALLDSDAANGAYFSNGVTVGEQYRTWGREADYYGSIANRSKAVVSISFDDGQPEDYNDCFPELRDWGMPWAENVVAARIRDETHLTQSELNEMVAYGSEVVCHTLDNVGILDNEDDHELLREQIIEGKRTLEDLDYQVRGLPGNVGIGNGSLDEPYDGYFAYLIRSAYDWSTSTANDALRDTNTVHLHGDKRRNPWDDGDYTAAKEYIDTAIAINGTLELYGHPGSWGSSELTAFTDTLDYLETKRDDGDLVVTTPSTMRLGDRDPDSVNFAPNPSAEAWNTFSDDPMWGAFDNPPQVNTDGGHTGDNYWVIGESTGSDDYGALNLFNPAWGKEHPCYMVEFWAKGASGGEEIQVVNRDPDIRDGNGISHTHTLTTSWQKFYSPIGFGRTQNQARLVIYCRDSEAHVDDIAIYPC